jgi:hypothetical protein
MLNSARYSVRLYVGPCGCWKVCKYPLCALLGAAQPLMDVISSTFTKGARSLLPRAAGTRGDLSVCTDSYSTDIAANSSSSWKRPHIRRTSTRQSSMGASLEDLYFNATDHDILTQNNRNCFASPVHYMKQTFINTSRQRRSCRQKCQGLLTQMLPSVHP